jgi:hypothetical protein
MCPDRGALSPAMRNRAVEIFLAESQMFVNSIADKIRLIGGTEFETSLALCVGAETTQVLDNFTNSNLLKICSFAPKSRQKLFGLTETFSDTQFVDGNTIHSFLNLFKQNVDFSNASLTDCLRVFYENAWAFFFQHNDPALVFFYSRILSGMQGNKALLFASIDKCNFTNIFKSSKLLIFSYDFRPVQCL